MRSHVRNASTEFWRIIEEGYSPQDPKSLTRREVVDDQLNATAVNMIHMAVITSNALPDLFSFCGTRPMYNLSS
jgi:hypothetical protein